MRKLHQSSRPCPRCGGRQVRQAWTKKTPKWDCVKCGFTFLRRVFKAGTDETKLQQKMLTMMIESKFTIDSKRMDSRGQLTVEITNHDVPEKRTIRVGRKGGLSLINCAEDRQVNGLEVFNAKVY